MWSGGGAVNDEDEGGDRKNEGRKVEGSKRTHHDFKSSGDIVGGLIGEIEEGKFAGGSWGSITY